MLSAVCAPTAGPALRERAFAELVSIRRLFDLSSENLKFLMASNKSASREAGAALPFLTSVLALDAAPVDAAGRKVRR